LEPGILLADQRDNFGEFGILHITIKED
jgi:hypothetical protein